jgi:hypothetical protein
MSWWQYVIIGYFVMDAIRSTKKLVCRANLQVSTGKDVLWAAIDSFALTWKCSRAKAFRPRGLQRGGTSTRWSG